MAPYARKSFTGFSILFFSFGDAETAAMCALDTTIAKISCAVTFLDIYRQFTAAEKKSRAVVSEAVVASLPHGFLMRGVVGGPSV